MEIARGTRVNIQNIPIRTPDFVKIRESFINQNNLRNLVIDYSAVEERLSQHIGES